MQFFGKYRGIVTVTADQDPDNMGRIKAQVPRILGTIETQWALPCMENFIFLPNGAGVWIEFEEGNIDKPVYTGRWWARGESFRNIIDDLGVGRRFPEEFNQLRRVALDQDETTSALEHAHGVSVTVGESVSGNHLPHTHTVLVVVQGGGVHTHRVVATATKLRGL